MNHLNVNKMLTLCNNNVTIINEGCVLLLNQNMVKWIPKGVFVAYPFLSSFPEHSVKLTDAIHEISLKVSYMLKRVFHSVFSKSLLCKLWKGVCFAVMSNRKDVFPWSKQLNPEVIQVSKSFEKE